MDEQPVDWTTVRHAPLGPAAPAYGPPTPGHPLPRHRHGRTWVVVLFAALAVAGGGVYYATTSHSTPQPVATFDVHGTLVNHVGCEGLGGAPDVRAGAQITLADGDGRVVGATPLQATKSATCEYTFAFSAVPGGSHFYAITIGQHGPYQFTEATLRGGPQVDIIS